MPRARLLVREIAEQQGLDSAKLGRMADVAGRTTYEIWKNPYRAVSTVTLAKIAKALNCNIGDLIQIEDEEPKPL